MRIRNRIGTRRIECLLRSSSSQPQTNAETEKAEVIDLETETQMATKNEESESSSNKPVIQPDLLQPFLPAMDPLYSCKGPVGDKEFVLCRTGEPTNEELSNENILKIVQIQCTDLEVNTLVWKCLGYRFDVNSESWQNDSVYPNWRERYPEPPDFVGMKRIYRKEVDEPSLRCNQALVRSIPMEYKQSLKPALKPLGFRGYQYAELTPNKTRRAQCANWLIYYRDHLFGYTVEELRERRRQSTEQQQQQEQQKRSTDGGGTTNSEEEEWKPPVREVF